MNPEEFLICKHPNYVIEYQLGDSQSKLTLRITRKESNQHPNVYQAYLTSEHLGKCLVTEHIELIKYLRQDEKHFHINFEQKYFKVMTVVGISNKYIQLIKVQLLSKEGSCQIETLEQIRAKCLMGSPLNGQEIKKFFVKIIDQIKNPPDSSQVIDSVINKLISVGNQNSQLQNKFQDLREKMQIQSLNSKLQIKQVLNIKEKIERQNLQMKDLLKAYKSQANQALINLERSVKQKLKVFNKEIENINKFSEQESMKTQQTLVNLQMRIFQILQSQKEFKVFEEKEELYKKPVKIQRKLQRIEGKIQENQKPERKGILQDFIIPYQQQKNYKGDNREIVKCGNQGQNNGIRARTTIDQTPEFKIKIKNTDSWGVSVGIKDIQSGQIIKYGGNGWISNCQKTIYSQGKGINSGDTVKIIVNKEQNEIMWQIENKQKDYKYETNCFNNKIGDQEHTWVPFICISYKDVIEIL